MSDTSSPSGRLGHAIADPRRGVVGFVDELLAASCRWDLQFDWHERRWRVSFSGDGPTDRIEILLRKSVFRAALARVASLCNQRHSDSVSPYGGRGELAIGIDHPRAVQVAFVNTAEEQTLDLAPIRAEERPSPGPSLRTVVD